MDWLLPIVLTLTIAIFIKDLWKEWREIKIRNLFGCLLKGAMGFLIFVFVIFDILLIIAAIIKCLSQN